MKRALFLVALGALGCGAPPPPTTPFSRAPTCSALGGLLDLQHAMRGATSSTDATGLRLLARIDEELGYLANAEDSPVDLGTLRRQLRERREEVVAALSSAAETRAALEKAEGDNVVERAGAALRHLDRDDAGSLQRTGAHLRAMSLDGTEALVAALDAHATSLRKLNELATPFVDATVAPDPVRLTVEKEVDALRLRCLTAIDTSHRIEARGGAPRTATVVVAPALPDEAERLLGQPRSFGSGFVVQWRDHAGQQRLRIITNHHVMGGAGEAEVRLSHHLDDEDAEPARARLLRSDPVDDIAILEVTEGGEQVAGAGLTLRPDAPSEREVVVAAGFPGVGRDPSYQVSEGVVSNARFGAPKNDRDGVSAYIQHTAAIDPGNSGGPLLDKSGAVVGVNTLKLRGRENVGLAIPTPRISLALLRADEPPRFDPHHAEASCQLAVAALGDPAPRYAELERFGLALYEGRQAAAGSAEATAHRDRLGGRPTGALSVLRAYAYAALRAELDDVGGAVPFTPCQNLKPEAQGFTAELVVRRGPPWRLVLAPSRGQLRLVHIERPGDQP